MTTDTQATGTAPTDAGGTQTTDQTASTTQAAQPGATTNTTAAPEAAVGYKFEAPEGVELDQGDLARFTDIAKELKLPVDAAKKIVDLAAKREIARTDAFAKQVADWGAEVKADPELGKPENLAVAKRVVDTFGDDNLRDLLNTSGMGNHPAVVRALFKIGKAISEDTFTAGRGNGNTPPRDAAEVLYGTPNKA